MKKGKEDKADEILAEKNEERKTERKITVKPMILQFT